MIWDEFLRHFRFCDEEDSELSDEERQEKLFGEIQNSFSTIVRLLITKILRIMN